MRLSGWLHELGLRQLIQRRRRGYLQFGHVRRNIAVLQETQIRLAIASRPRLALRGLRQLFEAEA